MYYSISVRLAAVIVTTCLCLPTAAAQSPPAPNLTRQQRDQLQAVIAAVDRAALTRGPDEREWLTHVLRASDGSHYVAFSIAPPAEELPVGSVVLYLRLATASGVTTVVERSIVREWLRGSRIDPRMLPRRGIAVGDMPPLGAGSIGFRGASSVGSADLQAMDLERQRSRERRENEERRRREQLAGESQVQTDLLPFEDFDVVSPASFADGTRAIQRALTAGPGNYELFVAWMDAAQPPGKAQVHVARRPLHLAPAVSSELGLSTVIVADQVSVKDPPYTPFEQRAHPYAIGHTDITPARDSRFTPNEQLSVAFQIVNATPSDAGKPDLHVNLRIVRVAGLREEPVASLTPLTYTAATLPPDFDLRLGHPIIAALSAPVATVPRGQYRLLIAAEDRVSGMVVRGATEFAVIGTPASLLAEAPGLVRRFDRAAVLEAPLVIALLDRLSPPNSSAALAKALAAARAGRYVDLLIEDAVPPSEQGIRAALTGLALFSLGDFGAAAQFERARQAQAAPAPTEFLLGAVRAMLNRDQDAILAWEASRDHGLPAALLEPFLAEAYLRRGDRERAAAAVTDGEHPDDAAWTRTFAATRIATRREAEAVAALDSRLARHPGDLEARWLLLHALFADFVNGNRDRRERLLREASAYIDAKGEHRALADAWMAVVIAGSR